MARIVFDLDGTLIDSAPDIHGIANSLLADDGLPPITLAQTRDFIGNGAPVFIGRLCAACGIDKANAPRLLDKFLARYDDAVALTKIYPGVVSVLETLSAQGHHLGICTNKPIRPTTAVLAHLGLAPFFQTVWGGDSLPVHKPDPGPLHAAFDALPEGQRLYVGDSGVDAETAERAGVPFMLFTEGYRKVPVEELPHAAAFSDWAEFLPQMERVLRG